MSSITSELPALLAKVKVPGDFAVAGTVALLAPSLEVDGVGRVALPLLPAQARDLIAAAEQAPFGRGEATLVDPTVRKTWQIGPDRARLGGRGWAKTFAEIIERAAAGLGVTEPVTAEFYKLLIYDPGSFFVGHRDTEKSPGMFATLLVALPADFSGGDLLVRHRGRELRLDMGGDDPGEARFAAFFADCVHEVLPITAGFRLVLVYNLLRPTSGKAPRPPDYTDQQTRVARLLNAWRDDLTAPDGGDPRDDDVDPDDDDEESGDDAESGGNPPQKLVLPLAHAYTQAELGFSALKGADAAWAGVLAAAAAAANCDLHLALLTVEQNGSAEYGGRYGQSDDDDFEVGEIFDWTITLSDWRGPDGAKASLGDIPARDDEIAPPDMFEELEPDEQHFHEATGNEGASFDRTYRRSALVLWPTERIFAVLTQAPLDATLPYLDSLADRWAAATGTDRDASWRRARELAGQMILRWPAHPQRPSDDKAPTFAARFLGAVTRIGDDATIERFLATVTAKGRYDTGDNAAIIAALACLPPGRRLDMIEAIVGGTCGTLFAACAHLLAGLAGDKAVIAATDLAPAAALLVAVLPGKGDPVSPFMTEPRGGRVQPDFVVDLLTALTAIDTDLAERAVAHLIAFPKKFDPDAVLIPAIRRLTRSGPARGAPAVEQLRVACLAHLDARIALPLVAPADWSRPAKVGCACENCKRLSSFLADPKLASWTLKARESDRRHVEATIREAHCDVDTTTERRGSPHGLVCAKNQASYDRRARQRVSDLEHRGHLAPS